MFPRLDTRARPVVLGKRRLQLDCDRSHHPEAHHIGRGGSRHARRRERALPVHLQEGWHCGGGGMTPRPPKALFARLGRSLDGFHLSFLLGWEPA